MESNSIPFLDFGGAVVYDLEQKHTLNEIIETAKKQERHNKVATSYFNLIDGLELPNIVTNLCLSENGEFLYIGGTYPPQFICYELENFCEKVTQHTYFHIVKMLSLPDYENDKFVCLYENRFVEFFSKHAKHEKVRVPKYCNEMVYNSHSCDLFVMGMGPFLWRFNLEAGQFMKPLSISKLFDYENGKHNYNYKKGYNFGGGGKHFEEILCSDINPVHNLISCGCNDGIIRCLDPRTRNVTGNMNVCLNFKNYFSRNRNSHSSHQKYLFSLQKQPSEIIKLKFCDDGVGFAAGTDCGQVLMLDLRKNGILNTFYHHNDSEIKSIIFAENSNNRSESFVISSDRFCVKVWNKNNNKILTNMEPKSRINDVVLYPDSGMFFVAQEREKVTPYYIPKIGPTPGWCSFLENFIGDVIKPKNREEYAFENEGVDNSARGSKMFNEFENEFVSIEDIKRYGLDGLISTEFLKPHLHGYVVHKDLLGKVKKLGRSLGEKEIENIKNQHLYEKEVVQSNRVKLKKKKRKKKRKRKSLYKLEFDDNEEYNRIHKKRKI